MVLDVPDVPGAVRHAETLVLELVVIHVLDVLVVVHRVVQDVGLDVLDALTLVL